jgi:tetratricopeptide (TPR) repeat protein
MGNAYAILGQVEKAKECYERAIGLFRALDNPTGELLTLKRLGSILLAFGDHGAARERFEAALALARKVDAKADVISSERALADLAHRTGARAEAWERFAGALRLEDELKSPGSRLETLLAMAEAALREEDFARAAAAMEEARRIPAGGKAGERDLVLVLCRLARARRGLGEGAEALAVAAEAERRLEALGPMTPDVGPEIHFSLSDLAADEGGKRRHLESARSLLERRQSAIRNDGYREHYLTRTWPNPEILAEAGRILKQ